MSDKQTCTSCFVEKTSPEFEFRKDTGKPRRQCRECRRPQVAERNRKFLKAIEQVYIDRLDGHHVDHEIPLQGELVSGLHVAENLQYLTGPENMSKGNSFNPDDWYWVKGNS